MTGATTTPTGTLEDAARLVHGRARGVQALLARLEQELERGHVQHAQTLNDDTATQLRNRSEYRMYVMAVDAMHFRQRVARMEVDGLQARLRRVLNRIYGDCYQIYRILVPRARFPEYVITQPERVYPLSAVEEMAHAMQAAAPPPPPPPDA